MKKSWNLESQLRLVNREKSNGDSRFQDFSISETYLFFQLGGRFSKNAFIPSTVSSVRVNSRTYNSCARSSAFSKRWPVPSLNARFVRASTAELFNRSLSTYT